MSKLPMKVLNQLNSYHGLNGVINELNTNRNNVQENSLIIVY